MFLKKIGMLFKVKVEYGERRERKRDEGVGERERGMFCSTAVG